MGNKSTAPQENEQRERERVRKRTAADLPRGNESPAIVRRDENKRLRERLTAGRERAKSELKSDHTRDEKSRMEN